MLQGLAALGGQARGVAVIDGRESDAQLQTLHDAGVRLIDCVHKTPAAQPEGFPYVGIPQMKDGVGMSPSPTQSWMTSPTPRAYFDSSTMPLAGAWAASGRREARSAEVMERPDSETWNGRIAAGCRRFL